MEQCTFDSGFGRFLLTADGDFLTGVMVAPGGISVPCNGNRVLLIAQSQILEYFCGKRREFDLPLKYGGTQFQQRVWDALRNIPYGKTFTYSEVATICGIPKGARAVGNACHRNPLLVVVPCHRVVAVDGGLCGFAAGVELKAKLLSLEKSHCSVRI